MKVCSPCLLRNFVIEGVVLPTMLTFCTVLTLTKSGHFKTTYLSCLVYIVCERPLTMHSLLNQLWNSEKGKRGKKRRFWQSTSKCTQGSSRSMKKYLIAAVHFLTYFDTFFFWDTHLLSCKPNWPIDLIGLLFSSLGNNHNVEIQDLLVSTN